MDGVLALRGDSVEGQTPAGVFEYASELVSYIRENRPQLKIYGACYPEKHPQAETINEDVDNLEAKVDAGVTHLISQLFYSNDDFYRFLDKARAAGINVPIEAGIMPVTNAKSVRRMSATCRGPRARTGGGDAATLGDEPAALREAGIAYASQQVADLIAHGVDGVHLYTMNHPAVTRRIWNNVSGTVPELKGTGRHRRLDMRSRLVA